MVRIGVLPLFITLFSLTFAAGCEVFDSIRSTVEPRSPHERYEHSLRKAGLDRTALGRAWLEASQEGLSGALHIDLPFREVTYVNPSEPAARGYRLSLRRGELLHIQVKADTGDSAAVFLDLYRAPADSGESPTHVTSATDSLILQHETRRDGEYLVRLQPELLRGGRFEVTAWTGPSLTFPVAGKNSQAIGSYYGADRDGGSRRHEGVDIFAPRGTPVVAASDGFIYRAGTNRLGGKVVFLRDDRRNQVYYYAHLDSQLVAPPLTVDAGDTLGLVGNTGNAAGTPPHLHFGIYSNGALDPLPFIRTRRTDPPRVSASIRVLGDWMRARSDGARLRRSPDSDADAIRSLPPRSVLKVVGSVGAFHRALLPDGSSGFVPAREVETTQAPIRSVTSDERWLVQFEPFQDAAPIDQIERGTRVTVLGQWEEYLLVESPRAISGWITIR